MTYWIRPGVRATPEEASEHRAKLRARAAQNRAAEEAGMAEALRGWRRALVRPWYISMALDARGLEGPEVDRACGVEEPVVDLWEAGEIYPTFEQLVALAKLTDFRPWWFVRNHDPHLIPPSSSLYIHLPIDPNAEASRLVLRFRPEAIAAHAQTLRMEEL